jgi:hypothetical protein
VSETALSAAERAMYASEIALSGSERPMIGAERSMFATADEEFRTFQRNRQDFLPHPRDDSRALASHGGGPDSERDRRVGAQS